MVTAESYKSKSEGFARNPDSESLNLLIYVLIFELAFLVAYWYAMNLTPATGAPFWAPDSVLLCALLLSRPRDWWIYLVSALPLRLAVAVPHDTPSWFLLVAFANDSLNALVAALLLRRMLPGQRIRFDNLRDFWIYLAAAVVAAPALSGLAGAASWAALGREFGPAWRDWFLGDLLANLVLTPLLLCLADDWKRAIRARPARYLEGFVVFSGLILAVQFAYKWGLNDPSVRDLYNYIPLAFLLLAAVRFGPAGASGALTIMSMLWIAASSSQLRPSSFDDMGVTLSIQLFLIVIGTPMLSLSVLLEQQRKTEQCLRESEGRFRNMADTAPVMIWVAGEDKRATFFNRAWLDFSGRSLDRQIGFGWLSAVHPEHRERCLAAYSASFDRRRQWQTECLMRRVDGEDRWMLCNGAPRFNSEGQVAGYIVSVSDITDLKRAQEASLARQKLESLGVLAGGIAHDFNNLLAGIQANADLAESSQADGAFPGDEIQAIKEISRRASGIIRQLMLYAGDERSDTQFLDLSDVVEEILDLIKISVSKSAVLRTNFDKNLPAVLGNGPQIQQVVMNLVLNASEALAGKEGVITVTTSLAEKDEGSALSSVAAQPGGKYVCLEVSDTGSGIGKEAQAKIFDPFFTTKLAGRGFGLAVVQGVVRAHNGAIELSSAPGQGTTFRIFWPLAASAPDVSAKAISVGMSV
jgi:PAS domain S-box-containing protein